MHAPFLVLKGHFRPCSDLHVHENSAQELVSISEHDKTCRLWDLQSGKQTACIFFKQGKNDAIPYCRVTSYDTNYLLVHDAQTQFAVLDKRKLNYTLPINVVSQCEQVELYPAPFAQVQDNEMNAMDVQGLHMCACDDSGHVYMYERASLMDTKWKLQRHTHICSTVLLFVHHNVQFVLSGGLDCCLYQAHVASGQKQLICKFGESLQPSSKSKAQFINPPMIHAMSLHQNNQLLAIALGNGTMVYMECKPNQQQGIWPIWKQVHDNAVHNYMISHVAFVPNTNMTRSCALDQTITLYHAKQKQVKQQIHYPNVISALVVPNEKQFIIADEQESHLLVYQK